MPPQDRPQFTPEERTQLEVDRQALAELLIEALETCHRDGSWAQDEGIVDLDDTLVQILEREDPPQAA